jgi:hypothetical protein
MGRKIRTGGCPKTILKYLENYAQQEVKQKHIG